MQINKYKCIHLSNSVLNVIRDKVSRYTDAKIKYFTNLQGIKGSYFGLLDPDKKALQPCLTPKTETCFIKENKTLIKQLLFPAVLKDSRTASACVSAFKIRSPFLVDSAFSPLLIMLCSVLASTY